MKNRHYDMTRHFTAAFLTVLGVFAASAQQRIDLYPAGAVPGGLGTDTIKDIPCIYIFRPSASLQNGSAMVICPGGGYNMLSMVREGSDAAAYFNAKGMTCFVLRYRLCSNGYTRYPIRNDGFRAMRFVRSNAKQWNIDTARIGVMGFSAGGHMASMMSTQFDDGNPSALDTVERAGSRPAFSVLVYPVITATQPYDWDGLRSAGGFLGSNPSVALVDSFSSEKQVTRLTPRVFLVHDYADNTVPYQNSTLYRDSCQRRQVSAVFLRVYNCNPKHGFGLSCGNWADTVSAWMTMQGIYASGTGIREGNGLSRIAGNECWSGNATGIQWYDLRGNRVRPQGRAIREGLAIRVAVDKKGRPLSSEKRFWSSIIKPGR